MKVITNKFTGLTVCFVFALLVLLFSFVPASAQTDTPQPQFPCGGDKPFARRTLDEVLCLEDEQRRKIRMINQEMKEQLDVARRRLLFAQRALDEAVYGNNDTNEATIEQRARDLGNAQAEFSRVRSLIDFRIRRVLTQEQVNRFRIWREWRIRQKNNNMKRQMQDRPINRPIQNKLPIQENNRQKLTPINTQTKPQSNKKP
jgi:Spy/CpxP family protein refolding chaperone